LKNYYVKVIFFIREPPLPLRGISPKGEKKHNFLKVIYLNSENISPPGGSARRARGVMGRLELEQISTKKPTLWESAFFILS